MKNYIYLSNIAKVLHSVSFLAFFFLMKEETNSISWKYVAIGGIFLLLAIYSIESMCKSSNEHILSPITLFLKILVPSSLIYAGLFIAIQILYTPLDYLIVIFTSLTFVYIVNMSLERYYNNKNNLRIRHITLLKRSNDYKEGTEIYNNYQKAIEEILDEMKNKKRNFLIKLTSSNVIVFIVLFIVGSSVITNITNSSVLIFNMIFFSYLIPIALIAIPSLALRQISAFGALNKEYEGYRPL